jgi:Tfp pilus assembly protein PilF
MKRRLTARKGAGQGRLPDAPDCVTLVGNARGRNGMGLKDRYDNPVATASQQALEHYIEGVDCFLAARYGAMEAFQAALAADPGFALAHAGLARAAMMAGDMALAKSALARAAECAAGASARERQHIGVFELLIAGRAAEARAAVFAHLQEHPRDAMVAQLNTSVFGLIGFSGQTGREADLLAFTSALMPHYGDDWWMQSQHAISLCETGHTAQALDLMERALDAEPRNANASHFKAHSHYERGETEEGRNFLRSWLAGYDRRSVIHGHLSWHVALWSLHLGETEAMWAAMDDAIAPGTGHGLPLNVLTDTASLLYRAEIAGEPVAPERWRALSDYAAGCFPESGQNFADLHAALAHAMAGQGEALDRMVTTARGFAADLVAPMVEGWRAVAAQDWQGALAAFVPLMAAHERLGGSRAQRDLIEFSYLNILLKLGHRDEAHRLMRMRRPSLGSTAPVAGF